MSIETGAVATLIASPHTIQAGYGAALSDVQGFSPALQAAAGPVHPDSADPISPTFKGMLDALEKVNGEANTLGDAARSVQAQVGQITPGQMVMLTVRCQEFMFHCQLASNIANRTSDGLQQLFRQQG